MSQTKTRIYSAVLLIIAVLFIGYLLPDNIVVNLGYVIGYLMAYESLNITGFEWPWLIALLIIPMMIYIPLSHLIFVTVAALWFMRTAWMLLAKSKAHPLLLMACQFLDIAVFMNASMLLFTIKPFVLLGVVVLVTGVDTVGYFVGKAYGKHRLLPMISPNKTLEGYIGGALWAICLGVIFMIVHQLPILPLTLGLVVVYILSITGDLLVSYQKRILKVKDSGSLIPGHGGLLDRFDSWMFAIPFVLFIVN